MESLNTRSQNQHNEACILNLNPEFFHKQSDFLWTANNFGVDAKVLNEFYSEAPFPDYKEFDNIETLIQAPNRNPFVGELSRLLGPADSFLEVGCGTGQLSNYLAATTLAEVIGIDGSINSISLGAQFANNNNLHRAKFIQMDLFDIAELNRQFEYVWCSGVLHHTNQPKLGFIELAKLVKPQGLIFIGLYNHISRLRTVIRQKVFSLLGGKDLSYKFVSMLDPYARACADQPRKLRAWINDQYKHPIESLHSMNEVNNWFKENSFELVGCIPNIEKNQPENVIRNDSIKFDSISSILHETGALFGSNGSEGGLFLMIGRKV